ncbi:tetratricopeptide repeat protein [Flavobacterium wongokense]|uniref:tetratricopeptide repeat protein n=1 Tax=Flavobacterium wongokense TaxID=2910674 RepID=UPI001F341F90|nr:tetratricopeptide repeat protein [Flavobacterium sp. WG47]MCF6130908.1 tetratricopeptide repeat protein [Flavobacterium sp. WG47]
MFPRIPLSKTISNTILVCCVLLLSIDKGYAQSTTVDSSATATASMDMDNIVTLKDGKEISYQAQATIESLQNLLNYVTFSDNAPSELAEVLANSYKPSRNRVFYDSKIIIEDDLNPASGLGNTKDSFAENYLNDLDLQYEKTTDATITFSNITVSNVKKKDYIFVKVRFDSNFGSKYKPNDTPYATRQREALIRMDKTGATKWEALIMAISFYNPQNPIEGTDNNMQIATDATLTASVVSQEDFEKEKLDFIRLRQEEEKRRIAIFNEYMNLGSAYSNNKQYKEALGLYEKAKELQPLVPSLDKRIIDTKKLMEENTFENFKIKGDKAKSERRFNDAILFYNQAILLKPDQANAMQADLSLLTQKLAIIALPNNKLQSGDFEGAIEECDRVLKEHKKEKNEFPELFFIKGNAYIKLGEKTNDKDNFEKALENYNVALTYFPNYKDARLARVDYFVNRNNNIVSAITDYDVLATNELDDSPDKPMFFVKKAKLKDRISNSSGALGDYDKAIALSPNNASIYFDKAEYQYRLQLYPSAQGNFDMAIKLKPDYALAYYYRGLNNFNLKNIPAAGKDFATAESISLSKDQIAAIESISNDFFLKAEEFLHSHDFIKADNLYNEALEIRKCNAKALHGKAEILLIRGTELRNKNSESGTDDFKQSIALNKRAIECDPKFSDAFFKEGLAHNKLLEHDLAVISFSNAIKSDNDNTEAYFERGNTYQIQKDYANANQNYNQLLQLLQSRLELDAYKNDKLLMRKLNADLSRSFEMKGQSQYFLKEYPSAILTLDKAVDLNKNNHNAIYYRGLAYYESNEITKAIKNFQEAYGFSPQLKYYYNSAKANFKNANYKLSIADFSTVIRADSTDVFSDKYYLRGLSLYKNKQYKEAVNDFEKYSKTESSKTNSSFYVFYGLCQLFIGQDSPAEDNFNRALTLDAKNGWALFGLGCSNAKAGQYDMAIDLIEKAFATKSFKKNDIEEEEDSFLAQLNKVNANKIKYNELKEKYLPKK